jgi:glycosyltransferase involved in cell wall biosynthesis
MRILMPSIVDPGARSGASTVTRNLIRLLETSSLDASVDWIAIPRTTSVAHRVRQAGSIARSLVLPMPAKVAYTYSRAFRRRILERATTTPADLVMINGSDLLWLDPMLPAGLPRVLIAHNIEHELFASQMDKLPGVFPVGPLLQREYRRLKQAEHDGMRRVGNALFLSTVDAERAQAAGVTRSTIVVPPLFGEHVVRHQRATRTGERLELGFLGNLHWWPNREGLAWFVRSVLQAVNRPVHLNVFGDGPFPAAERVTRHGPIADVTQAWERCDLMICPTRSGGGVSIKLAEAVFHGLPTLTTGFATRGLPLGSDPGLIVREETEWVTCLNTVDVSALRRRRIAEDLSRTFTFQAHRDRVQSFLGTVADQRRSNRLTRP